MIFQNPSSFHYPTSHKFILPFSILLQDFRIIFPALAFVSSGILALCVSTQRHLFLPKGHCCSYRAFVGMGWPSEQTKPGPEHTGEVGLAYSPLGHQLAALIQGTEHSPALLLLLPFPPPPPPHATTLPLTLTEGSGATDSSGFPCCISSNLHLLEVHGRAVLSLAPLLHSFGS